MSLLESVFSTDDNSTYPYTYQAVVNILDEDDSIQVSFFGDTICGLVAFPEHRGEDPGRTKIYEIYQGQETPVPGHSFITM